MREMICIVCPKGCHLKVSDDGAQVTGNACERGVAYGQREATDPRRVVTSTVRIAGAMHRRLPVKTNGAIPKDAVQQAVSLLDSVTVAHPIRCGDVILKDVLGTGIDFVATRNM